MSKPVVRVAQGFFEPHLLGVVEKKLREGRGTLEPALKDLHGLVHFYASIDAASSSFLNLSVWDSLEAATQMVTLQAMLEQRVGLVELGLTFRPVINYSDLWSITP